MRQISIGCGSGFAIDRFDAALALANSGTVDYLSFDCLAERTLALAQMRRLADPSKGQDERLNEVVAKFGPYVASGGTVIGNFGCANLDAALREVVDGLRSQGLSNIPIGVIRGDDVRDQVMDLNLVLPEMDCRVADIKAQIVSANAYIGAEPIVELLQHGARFILGGRIADPSLYVGPICHELKWPLDDWDRVARATLVGHLLECGVHSTGGNFSDPPYRLVPDLHDLGTPMATVSDTQMMITKLNGSGGIVNEQTIKSQLAYEIHDPTAYLTPDVSADFSEVTVTEMGRDLVSVDGVRGRPRPDMLKVLVGVDLGWKSVGEISFGGPGCIERANLAEQVVRKRLEPLRDAIDDILFERIGLDSLFGRRANRHEPFEVRLRVAARSKQREVVAAVADEVEYMYLGPAGGGGAVKSISRVVGVTPAFLPRAAVELNTEIVVA